MWNYIHVSSFVLRVPLGDISKMVNNVYKTKVVDNNGVLGKKNDLVTMVTSAIWGKSLFFKFQSFRNLIDGSPGGSAYVEMIPIFTHTS